MTKHFNTSERKEFSAYYRERGMEHTNRRNANEYGLFIRMCVGYPTDSVVIPHPVPD